MPEQNNWTATPNNCIGSQGRLGGTWPTEITALFSNAVCHTACCIKKQIRRTWRSHASFSLTLTPVVRNRVTYIRPHGWHLKDVCTKLSCQIEPSVSFSVAICQHGHNTDTPRGHTQRTYSEHTTRETIVMP